MVRPVVCSTGRNSVTAIRPVKENRQAIAGREVMASYGVRRVGGRMRQR